MVVELADVVVVEEVEGEDVVALVVVVGVGEDEVVVVVGVAAVVEVLEDDLAKNEYDRLVLASETYEAAVGIAGTRIQVE